MATSTRCAGRRAGRESGQRGYALCVLLPELAPGPASSSSLLNPPPLQARDTVTSELAAVKIVKLDPGEAGSHGLSAGGRPERVAGGRGVRGEELTFPRSP